MKTPLSELLQPGALSRRDFMKACAACAGLLGLRPVHHLEAELAPEPNRPAADWLARTLADKPRLPVVWLELQSCTGCSEALTRSLAPTLSDLLFNHISIEYHETLSAAAGEQVEANKRAILRRYAGQYLLVVEGSVPTGPGAAYCAIGGRSGEDLLQEAAAGAAVILATGNCAAYGGIPQAAPNPTGAQGLAGLFPGKPVVNLPGCPAIPEATAGTLLHYLIFESLPELDTLNRPRAFYAQTIHERCLRRSFYDAGQFAASFDDEGARRGWCLYKLGCKGPITYNACAGLKWGGGLSFPIQSGHPCLGCSEPGFWDGGGFYQGQSAPLNRPGLAAAGAALVAGAVVGAGVARLQRTAPQTDKTEVSS